jgi:hypothetical protein
VKLKIIEIMSKNTKVVEKNDAICFNIPALKTKKFY